MRSLCKAIVDGQLAAVDLVGAVRIECERAALTSAASEKGTATCIELRTCSSALLYSLGSRQY